MFVGQVPKSMDEAQLKILFEEYGRVYAINVLRNKISGASKGKSSNHQIHHHDTLQSVLNLKLYTFLHNFSNKNKFQFFLVQ